MRDILRWVLHWLGAPAAVETEGNIDVEIYDRPKTTIAIGDFAKHSIALADRTRGT